MKGVYYLTDEENKKQFVQIDLSLYGELWEDFMDALMASAHQGEETVDLDDFVKELKAEGLLHEEV